MTVLAVAMPRDVLAEYEGVVTRGGVFAGRGVAEYAGGAGRAGSEANGSEGSADPATLVVNAGMQNVTTAIVRRGMSAAASDVGDECGRGRDISSLTRSLTAWTQKR